MANISQSWFIRGAGATVVVAGSFFAALALIDAYDARNAASLLDDVRRGAEVQIKFDPKTCSDNAVGELTCEAPYVGHYDQTTNNWVLTGRTRYSATVVTNAFANAPNQPGNISFWGILGTFNGSGRLFIKGKDAGTIRRTAR
jgi:hypothetical protein